MTDPHLAGATDSAREASKSTRKGPTKQRLLGVFFFGVAAIAVPVASLVAIHLSRGPGATLAREKVRAVRSALDPIIGGALEERGLRLVEGHAKILRAAAVEFDIPVEWLGGVMFAESRGRSGQRSSAGALGLMQLVRSAARDAGKREGIELPADDAALVDALLTDDALNVRLGAAHLAWLIEHRGSWSDEAVMVSYNAGRSRLFQWIEKSGSYGGFVAAEEALARLGKPTTGALAYARQVLKARRTLQERGHLAAFGGPE